MNLLLKSFVMMSLVFTVSESAWAGFSLFGKKSSEEICRLQFVAVGTFLKESCAEDSSNVACELLNKSAKELYTKDNCVVIDAQYVKFCIDEKRCSKSVLIDGYRARSPAAKEIHSDATKYRTQEEQEEADVNDPPAG